MSVRIVSALILVAPALSMTTVASAKEGEVRTNSKGEKVICRSVQSTGSRMSKKVCRTAEEWKLMLEGSTTAANQGARN